MFTNEKIFTNNGYLNPKNSVVWADSRSDANKEFGKFEKEKYPISVMVALGATWDGLKTPYFFANGEKLNTENYCNVFEVLYKGM